MRTPSFWYESQGLCSTLLLPLSWVYGKGGEFLRAFKPPQRCSVPIISVGSVTCGGAGKTPTAIAIADLLHKKGVKVHFVSRGYGGKLPGPLEVNLSHHKASEVGDEPLLLAQCAPTWVAKNRPLGIQKASEAGAQLVILDDGHQTSGLYKDLSLVVVDFLQGFGNGCVLPAGPLREDLTEGFKRADALIGIGEGDMTLLIPSFRAQSIAQPLTSTGKKAVAFCGLGYPKKFYKTLENLGVTLVATENFPDHYVYTEKDLLRLYNLAQSHEAMLVTTRKDGVKIPPSWQKHLHILDISIQFESPEEIYDFILKKIPALEKN